MEIFLIPQEEEPVTNCCLVLVSLGKGSVPQYSTERRAGMLENAVLIQADVGYKMQQMF